MKLNIKLDHEIMKVLGVTELRHYIASTNLGELTVMIRKGDTEHFFVLDAVPVGKEQNKELMNLLFPPEIVVPQVNRGNVNKILDDELETIEILQKTPTKKPIKSPITKQIKKSVKAKKK